MEILQIEKFHRRCIQDNRNHILKTLVENGIGPIDWQLTRTNEERSDYIDGLQFWVESNERYSKLGDK